MKEGMTAQEKCPVILLTGFLGSGKTSLLNRLLKREDFANTLVIVNEFGDIGLDHLLVTESSDTILELSNGCLCCSVRGELVDTLLELDTSLFRQVVIETTGIADPLPVFQSIAANTELASRYRPAMVMTVVDGLRGIETLDAHEEARFQVTLADLVYISKTDLPENRHEAVRKKVSQINEHLTVLADPDRIPVCFSGERTIPSGKPHASHDHAQRYCSVRLETQTLLDIPQTAGLLHHLASTIGEGLLRVKGFVRVREHPDKPLVVQVSGPMVHDFGVMDHWPDGHEHTTLIAIMANGLQIPVQTTFDAFCGHLAADTPDRQALTENPLSVPGHDFRR